MKQNSSIAQRNAAYTASYLALGTSAGMHLNH